LYEFVGVFLVLLNFLGRVNYDISPLFCDENLVISEVLNYWTYIFYLSKFVEYFDTVYLIIKAKPVVPPDNSQYLLHIYHHAVTAAIVWMCIHFHFSSSWTGPLTNSFVHILMYGYYFLAEMNKIDRNLGGKFITPIQIVQFLFCLTVAIIEGVWNFTSGGKCHTHFGAYMFLFVNYIIFFAFFVKIFADKKNERIRNTKIEKKE